MKRAASFGARPQTFERLLAERAGIGEGELRELRDVHARAGRYLRSAAGKAAHAARQDAEREEAGVVEAIAAGAAAPAAEPHAPLQPAEAGAPDEERAATPDWRVRYKELQRDWNDLVARAEEPDLPLPLMPGYGALIQRVRSLAEHPLLSERARSVLTGLIDYDADEAVARETAEDYLAAAERHVEAYKALERQTGDRGVPVTEHAGWLEWREAAEMLATTGEAILSNEDRYGAYLDAMTIGKARVRLTVEQLRNRLHHDRTATPEPGVPRPRPEPAPKQEEGFAHILDDPEKLRELRKKAEERDRRLGRHQRRSRGISM